MEGGDNWKGPKWHQTWCLGPRFNISCMTSSQILTMKILSLTIVAAYPAIHPFMKVTTLNMLHLITPTINLNQPTLVVCWTIQSLRKATMMNVLCLITVKLSLISLKFTLNLNLSTLTMMRTIHPVMAMAINLDNPPLHSLKLWNLQLDHLLELVVNGSITLMMKMMKMTQTSLRLMSVSARPWKFKIKPHDQRLAIMMNLVRSLY